MMKDRAQLTYPYDVPGSGMQTEASQSPVELQAMGSAATPVPPWPAPS